MKIGVIGCGKFGQNHVRILKELGHDVFISERDSEQEAKVLKMYMVDVLKSPSDVDAVCIVTPTDTHYDLAKGWIRNRKHVFCEKPLCFKASEASDLVELAENMNVFFAVGHVFRFTDGAKLFKKLLESTNPHHIEMKFLNDKPPRADSDVLYNLTIHYLDLLDYVALGKPIVQNYGKEENYGHISLKYPRVRDVPIVVDIQVSCNTKKERSIKLISDVCTSTINLMNTSNEPLKDELDHFTTSISENVHPANYADVGIIKFLESLK